MHVYKITNLINEKVYIGQTIQKNPKRRWYEHCAQAKANSCKKRHLYNSMNLYGIKNFAWEIIDSAETLEELNSKENFWFAHYREITECYNIRETGDNRRHSPESIERMREAQRAAHARRRAAGTEGGWTRCDGGAMKGKPHPRKGTSGLWKMSAAGRERVRQARIKNNGTRGKTYIVVDGKRIYVPKENKN